MKRSSIRRDPAKTAEWVRKSRKPLPARSGKRKALEGQRAATRAKVAARAGGSCEYRDVIPEVPCGMLPGRGMEVDELRGGSWRQAEWLDPDSCRYTCPVHHDWKTERKREVLRRLGVDGYD